MRSSFLALLSPWSLLASAHFTLDYPAARGFDEDKLGTFPCSGFDTVKDRTDWPLGGSGGEVSLTMGHDQALVQVLLGIGNDVGEAFNYVLLPTVQEQGLGKFCLSGLQLPKGLNVTDGTNATIQCADITFRTSPAAPPSCQNNTGIRTAKNTTPFQNANQTNPGGSATSSSSAASSAGGSSSPSATAKTGGAEGPAAAAGGLWACAVVVAAAAVAGLVL